MEKVLAILSELKPDIDFETCDTLIDDEMLDSFDIISIVAELNDAFDINIPAAQIIPENFNSAQALHELITRLADE